MENKLDNKSKRMENRSRLPRMSGWNQLNGQQKSPKEVSSIPKPKTINNNNEINTKLIVCNNSGREKIWDDKSQNNKTNVKTESEAISAVQSDNASKTYVSLSKSQSLNEIQYENNQFLSKVNNLSNGCDSVKAFSFEQLDENYTDLSPTMITKENLNDSDYNIMDTSVDESSTASLGLLPNILNSMSPFDSLNPIIPDMISKCVVNHKMGADGDDDSENGIPTIQEDESDTNITTTQMDERPVTPFLVTNALNNSFNDNSSLDNTMESLDSTVVNQEMADEFETMNLDNAINQSKSFIDNSDNNNHINCENGFEICNKSEKNIPNLNSLSERNVINDFNEMNNSKKREQKVLSQNQNDKSSQVIAKSFNESKSELINKNRVENRKSTAIRPNSLNTTKRENKSVIITEKNQRAASPSSKASARKKIKTPGRWDAVMNKIEQNKNVINQTNRSVKGKVNTNININRNTLHNGSMHKISPSPELPIDMDSSHSPLTPSTSSVKSSITSLNKKTINSKVNIPKSKTFVRELTANNSAGNKSQQPSEPAPQPQAIAVQTNKKGVVASVNEKKTSNRRPLLANTASSTVSSKRVSNLKLNNSSLKKDIRSAQLVDDKQHIQRLTELCEFKTKQLKTLSLDQNYMRQAFDSLTVVIQHLIEQYTPFENPKLKQALHNANQRCEQLKDNLDAKDSELNDMKLIYEEQINQLMKEKEKNFSDLNQAKVNHELNVKKLSEMHCLQLRSVDDRHNEEIERYQQNCNELLNEIRDKNVELNQTKQLKDALESRVNQIEDNIMNDKDKKFKYLTEKSKQLELEVDSLKSVMDMKNEKIHTLERKMIETQEKIHELPLAKETIRGLQQQIENLQMTLEIKIHQFNQLSREKEDLKNEYDREMREKRRLSMKNEELVYHLSESLHNESSFNNCTNYDLNHTPWKSSTVVTEETPIKTNRPFIVSASTASSRKSHSKIIKSMSTSSAASKRGTPTLYCRSSNSDIENNVSINSVPDEVFDSGTHYKESKTLKSKLFSETPPQCILDSGFEEIQGLNSLSK